MAALFGELVQLRRPVPGAVDAAPTEGELSVSSLRGWERRGREERRFRRFTELYGGDGGDDRGKVTTDL